MQDHHGGDVKNSMASSIRQRIESWRIGAKLGRLLRVLGIVTAILLLLIVFLLGTDPGRHTLLKTFLPVALDKIPGHLTLDEASWPSLGRLEFAGVLWRNVASDTLLAATDCGLELSLGDLRHKDLYVKRIWAAELLADLPALQAQFTDTTASVEPQPAKSDTTQGGGVPFLRTGALTGIPSVGLDRLAIVDATIQLTENESIRLQELIASADLRQGRSPQLSARIRMRPRPALAFSTRLEANLSDSLRVGFAPLHLALADSGTIPDPASAPLTGFVTLSREELLTGKGQPAGTVSGLRVTGDFGQLILDGDLVRGGGGSFRLQAKRPPSRIKFMQALASIVGEESRSVSLADSLWTLWPATDGPDVDVHCEMTPAAGDQPFRPGRVAVSANFILPGPRDLKPFLPPESRVNDWDYIRGWLKAEAQLDHEPIDFQATLDLSETSWLDTALISLHGEPHHIMVDSLALALPGVALNVSGTWDPEQMDLRARVDIPDSSLLTRWQSEVTKDLDVRLALDAHARGPLTTPDLMAQFELSGHYQGLSIPSLLGRLQTDTREVNLTLEASEGLNYSDFELTSLWTQYSGNLPDSLGQFVGRFQVTASSSEHSLATEGSIEMGEVILLQVDSLATTWRSQRMVARQPFSLKQDSKDQLWQIVGLDIAGDPGHIWGEGTVRPDSIDVHLSLDLAVVVASLQEFATRPLPALAKDDTLLLAGNLRVKGTNVNPAGFLTLKTGIHGHEQLSRIVLETTAWLLPPGEVTITSGPISDIFANSPPLPANTPWPGLATTVRITHQDTLLMTGQGRFPTHISLYPFAWEPSLTDSVAFAVRSRTIHLAELHPYLPPGLSLKGECRFAADIRGVDNDFQVSGEFDAPTMETRLEDGSWLSAGGKIELEGTIQEPKVAGDITVNGGLFRLPEVPPHLLPTEGEALLWQAAAADSLSETALENLAVKQDRAEADSTLVKTDEPIPRQKIKPSLAVQVIIPGNLWIRGHGLDVQLTGNMDVGMRAGLPAAAGELKAVHGTFRLLGRVFEIERGKVTLYGDEVALNPELDLSLITYVSGTLIRVQLLGTALEPELILTSEPYLSEADIISMLLFGQQMYQLDSGQEDLLRSRTNEILASYGASQLQDQVGSQMGIDIITYGQGTDKDSTAGSLTIGKYLSPKVLMKYERVLDKRSAYYVHLNYTINRNFRIETTYSEGNNSGVSFKWAKDY